MSRYNSPHEYPVLRRPPRDFFSPVARPIAGLLYTAIFIAVPCFIGFGAHNLAARQPAMVNAPEVSTYARDYRDSPVRDLVDSKLEYIRIPVRLKDQGNLRKHIHQDIIAHGGVLVLARLDEDAPLPTRDLNDRDAVRDKHVYHVNHRYLERIRHLDKPPWDHPTYYGDWVRERTEHAAISLSPRDTHIRISTTYLAFENTRVRFLTMVIAAGICGALLVAIALSVGMSIAQERSRLQRY